MLDAPKLRRVDEPIAVSLAQLVPANHFSRHLAATLDLAFAANGRGSCPPIAVGQNLKRFLAASVWGQRHAPCGILLSLPREPKWLSAVYG